MSQFDINLMHNNGYPSYDPSQKTNRRNAPVLYVIASKRYKKQTLNRSSKKMSTSLDLWNEMISQNAICSVLQDWINTNKLDIDITTMAPFRMILHQLNQCKVGIIKKLTKEPTSMNQFDEENTSKYFALIWVPFNDKTGFTKQQYQNLIDAINCCDYICKPLNKDCIYISGPKYNDSEFNLLDLAIKCDKLCNDTEHIINSEEKEIHNFMYNKLSLKYTIIIHEMSVGDVEPIYIPSILKIQREEEHKYSMTNDDIDNNDAMEKFTVDAMQEMKEIKVKHNIKSTINLSRVLDANLRQNKSMDINIDNDSKQKQHETMTSYAFPETEAIYFERPIPRDRRVSEIKINSMHSTVSGTFTSFAFIWITPKKESIKEQIENQGIINSNNHYKYPKQMTLPSYAVMKRLHKQPIESDAEILYDIELMAYDDCWDDLDLVVDRKFIWKDALLLLLQFIFLPIFVLCPIFICFKNQIENNIKPRYRPNKAHFYELDKTEQIPFDITVLWRPITKKNTIQIKINNNGCCHEFIFRFISFIICSIIYGIICIGPIFYHLYTPKKEDIDNNLNGLQFFDAYGPMLLYILCTFTVIWWSCDTRILIGPKQHLLLYHKLYLHRPISSKHRAIPRTDWGALINLHEAMAITLFTFAYKKEFLRLERPTNKLIDPQLIIVYAKSRLAFKFIFIIFMILAYIAAMNVENFEFAQHPFYIGTDNEMWLYFTIYNICSVILQSIFLFGFILLWETMLFRTYNHFNNIRTLSHLIIRDTKTEYIALDDIDNILSWLTLENFVKRKGMTLFSSVETPLLSLCVLAIISWGATFYCIVQGVGLRLKTDDSMFSNSALVTWLYLGILALIYTCRMIYSGHLYYRETVKQSWAIKRQCRRENKLNLTYFLNKDQLKIEQYLAQQSCELLLQHIEHSEIVPKVFGIQFDELLAKAFITAAVSIIPTVFSFLGARITQQ